MFDESSDRYKDSNPLGSPSKPIELFIPPIDLVNSISQIAEANGSEDNTKNQVRNNEKEILTIRDEHIKFVIASQV